MTTIEFASDFKGQSWVQFARESTDRELLAIIRSTNPAGRYALGRVAAMDEWDRRHPVAKGV